MVTSLHSSRIRRSSGLAFSTSLGVTAQVLKKSMPRAKSVAATKASVKGLVEEAIAALLLGEGMAAMRSRVEGLVGERPAPLERVLHADAGQVDAETVVVVTASGFAEIYS